MHLAGRKRLALERDLIFSQKIMLYPTHPMNENVAFLFCNLIYIMKKLTCVLKCLNVGQKNLNLKIECKYQYPDIPGANWKSLIKIF